MLLNCGAEEDSWESLGIFLSLFCKEIQPVHPKGDQSWVFNGRTDVEAKTPILWPPDAKIWLIWKDPDAGKDWGQVEKGMTEDEMVGWHHWLNGYEFQQAPAVGDGWGSLACCSPWGCKESDMTVWLNWTEPTPVFWPGEVREQRSLAGYSSWGHKELDMTEWQTTTTATQYPSVVSAVKSSPKGKCWGNNEQSHVQV